MVVDAEVRGLVDTQDKLEQVIADLHGEPVLAAFRRATLLLVSTAKRLAPVDRGILRGSIVPQVRMTPNRTVEGVVGSNVTYAPHMEFGTGIFAGNARYFPPPSALDLWASRHGMESGALVALAIYRRGGTRPRRYLQGSADQHRDEIRSLIGDAVTRIVKK
jgi:hypothetical protein